jgi:hypothetical protein
MVWCVILAHEPPARAVSALKLVYVALVAVRGRVGRGCFDLYSALVAVVVWGGIVHLSAVCVPFLPFLHDPSVLSQVSNTQPADLPSWIANSTERPVSPQHCHLRCAILAALGGMCTCCYVLLQGMVTDRLQRQGYWLQQNSRQSGGEWGLMWMGAVSAPGGVVVPAAAAVRHSLGAHLLAPQQWQQQQQQQ